MPERDHVVVHKSNRQVNRSAMQHVLRVLLLAAVACQGWQQQRVIILPVRAWQCGSARYPRRPYTWSDGVNTTPARTTTQSIGLGARRPRQSDDNYEDDEDYYDFTGDYPDDDERRDQKFRPTKRRQQPRTYVDNLGDFNERSGLNLPSSFGRRQGWRLPDSVSKALLAGVFVLGVGLGVTVDSQVNTNPRDLASRDAIDQAAPNANLCASMGASAMAFDQRVFVSFNPFNVYVSQADVKPACVLRDANVVSILQARHLINDDEVRACKQHINTWAFVGDLDSTPQLSCVYQSQDAQNEFLSDPKMGIGEDYLKDDRAKIAALKSTGKIVKGGMTQAQKDKLRKEQGMASSLLDEI